MSTLGATAVTTADLRNSLDPKGNPARIYELLEMASPVVKNGTWMESNMPNGHQSTIQATEETATKRDYDSGVASTKTVNRPVIDLAVQYAAYIQVDVNKLEEYPNPKQYLAGQERRKIVAMKKDFESDFFYGNQKTNIRDIDGLATRFNALSSTVGAPGYQVVSAGGSTNLTSLYLVGFGDDGVTMFYPMGSEAGVTRVVKENELVQDSTGSHVAYCIFNNWKVGLTVGNFRNSFLRIANIDTAAVATYGTSSDTSPDIVGLAIRSMERMDELDPSLKYCWFGDELVVGWLKTMYRDTHNINLTMGEAQNGMPTVMLGGIPVYKSMQIVNSETAVV